MSSAMLTLYSSVYRLSEASVCRFYAEMLLRVVKKVHFNLVKFVETNI